MANFVCVLIVFLRVCLCLCLVYDRWEHDRWEHDRWVVGGGGAMGSRVVESLLLFMVLVQERVKREGQ